MTIAYTITLNDPTKSPQDTLLVSNVSAALNRWSSILSGNGTIDVAVNVTPLSPAFLAEGSPGVMVSAGTDGSRTVTQSGVVSELVSGIDPNGTSPDIVIDVNSNLLGTKFYLNPAPYLDATVPSGSYDAITIITHELAHGFGIVGNRSQVNGTLPASTESTWDRLVTVRSDGSAVFTGGHAEAVYGGPVPVTTIKNGQQYYHLGNSADAVQSDLMGGTGLATGTVRGVSDLDIAILQDLNISTVHGNPELFGDFIYDAGSAGGKVYALYDALLGRAPDPLGLEGWVNALNSGGSVRDVAASLLVSPEGQVRTGALDNTAFVTQLYQTALGRPPDATGLQAWTTALASGTSRADVAAGFALSTEHVTNIEGALSTGVFVPDANADNVARLYYAVLDRAPDAGGLVSWTRLLSQGGSLQAVAQAFLGTPEAQTKTAGLTNAQFVDTIYDNALGRHAEATGLAYWTDQLDHGASRVGVTTVIGLSPEARLHHMSDIETGWNLA